MTHPTDEELDALAAEAMDRSIERLRELAAYAGRPSWEKILREELSAPITALRAQLAEVRHLMHMRHQEMLTADGLMRKHQDRADRAEAALAAQIEADAGIADAYPRHGLFPPGITISSKILSQPHDRTALDRMLLAEREKALREAADAFMDGSAPRMTILAMIEQENQK